MRSGTHRARPLIDPWGVSRWIGQAGGIGAWVGLVLIAAACGGNRPHQIEASNLPRALTARPYTEIGATSATSCQTKLFSLFALDSGGRLYDAKAEAIAAAGADALVEAVVDTSSHSFLFIGRSCVTVSGTAIRFEGGRG